MTLRLRHPELFLWFGLFGGALAWAAHLVVGFGLATADCSPAGTQWGIDLKASEIALTAAAATIVLLAELAALAVLRDTWGTEEDGAPPRGRLHFFALAAVVGNVLFLVAVVLAGAGSIVFPPCQGA